MKKYIKFVILGLVVGVIASAMGMNIYELSWWVFVVSCNIIGCIVIIALTKEAERSKQPTNIGDQRGLIDPFFIY